MKTHEERAAEIAQFVIDSRHSQGYRHNMSSHELFHLIRDKIVEGLKDSEKWVSEYGLTEKGVKNIIRKGKMAIIKPNISEIWPKEFDVETSESEESQTFFNEYAGKKCYVYKWSGDWWIANEDNHCLTENCFTPTT